MTAKPDLKVEKIPLGFWKTIFAVCRGVRLVKNRLWFNGEPLEKNSPCPCGSGKKFRRCCGKRRML